MSENKMHIGPNLILHSATLVIPDNEKASVEFTVGALTLKTLFSFDNSARDEDEMRITVEAIDDVANITFFGWNNPLGTGLKEPATLANISTGQKVLFILAHHRVGEINKLDVNFLLTPQ